ncbi:MAG: hypothetical protein RR712_03365 [Terrisporobacter sp.]
MKVFYNTTDNLVEMDIVETRMCIQRDVYDDYQECHVYVSRCNKYYIQVNDARYNWSYSENSHGILITDLTDKIDIEILEFKYGNYILTEEAVKEIFNGMEKY